MQVYPISKSNITTKSHYYKVNPFLSKISVCVSKNEKQGKLPFIICKDSFSNKLVATPMDDKNTVYASEDIFTCSNLFEYYIKYKDSKFTDKKNGKKYSIPINGLYKKATEFIRNLYKQPLVKTIKSGSTTGLLLYKEYLDDLDFNEIKEPTILLTKNIPYMQATSNDNLLGIIIDSNDIGSLEHIGANMRTSTEVACCIFDKNIADKLKTYDGKNVQIIVGKDSIDCRLSDKVGKQKVYPNITIPKLKYSNKVLNSEEYLPKLVGAKAVNLRRLEKLVEDKKIDVIIPKSITLTHGYIQDMFDENIEQQQRFDNNKERYICKEEVFAPYRKEFCEKRMLELLDLIKKNKLSYNSLIARSAFNGEDLKGYSAAGLYDSIPIISDSFFMQNLYESIVRVAQSKWKKNAVISRQMYQIKDDDIKPSVIIQNLIPADYTFTLYTEYEKDKLRIEMNPKSDINCGVFVSPHVFTFDKKNDKLSYDSICLRASDILYDENLEPLPNQEPIDDLSKNTKIINLVRKLVDNALIIEKEFGAPQDIEGGFKDNNIYLWQTRNIVYT